MELAVTFDYMRSARPRLLTRLIEFRIPARLHAASFALLCALGCTSGAWALENERLHAAQAVEQQLEGKYADIHARVERANILYERVSELAGLDRQVRDIVASGDTEARRLTEIAGSVPDRVWLTSIAQDGSDIAVDGGARNLSVLSVAVRALARGRLAANPALVRARTESTVSGTHVTAYTLRLERKDP